MGQAPAQMRAKPRRRCGPNPRRKCGRLSTQMWFCRRSRLRCYSQFQVAHFKLFALKVRFPMRSGPSTCAHVSPDWAHMLFRRSEENQIIAKRAFCRRITSLQCGRSGHCRSSLTMLTRTNSSKHVGANRTANPAEVGGEGLGQVPA